MRKKTSFLYVINFIFLITRLSAQNTQSNFSYVGPNTSAFSTNKGLITSLWIDPNNQNYILAGSNTAGLWKTNDGGINWISIYQGHGVQDIEVDPTNGYIYLATGTQFGSKEYGEGILLSTDGGSSWNDYALQVFPQQNIALYVLKLKPGTGGNNPTFVIGASNGLYLYNRAGNTTTLEHRDYNGMQITDIEFHPTNPNIVYWTGRISKGGAEIYRTNNFFNSEANITPDFVTAHESRFALEVCAAAPNNVYISYADYIELVEVSTKLRLAVSENMGAPGSWVQKSFSTQPTNNLSYLNNILAVSPADPNIIYLGGVRITKSVNGGNVFTNVHSNIHDDIRSIEVVSGTNPNLFPASSKDIVLVGNDGGISKTINGVTSSSWQSLNGQSLQNNQFHALGTHKFEKSLNAGAQDNHSFSLNEAIWRNWSAGDNYETVVSDKNPKTMFVQGNPANIGSLLYKTVAAGAGYVSVNAPAEKSSFIRPMYQFANDDLYMGYHNIWKSTDFGSTWIQKTNLPFTEAMTAFDISESNPNTAYISLSSPIYNGTLQHVLFKYNLQANTYNDLTANFKIILPGDNVSTELARWFTIQDIAVNPIDENKVWVVLAGNYSPSKNYQVIYTNDGGTTWSNFSNGLPGVPVNVIKVSPKGEMFLGTDYGVYYRADQNENITLRPWQLYTNGSGTGALPKVIVTDIEFSVEPCRGNNVMTVSTFGRGIWETEIQLHSGHYLNTTISANTTITNSDIKVSYGDYIINAGTKLIVRGTLKMPESAHIYLEKGATLEVNGGTITSNCDFWGGIITEGEADQPILPLNQTDTHHARVILKNGATIKNALTGIYTSGGAFVSATNSNFIDNKVALDFNNFPQLNPNSLPPLGGTQGWTPLAYNDPSSISNCTFETQTVYTSGNIPTSFIKIERNKGIQINNSRFKNISPNLGSYETLGNGITAIDAGYTVRGCEFYHLNYAIKHGTTYLTPYFPTITNNHFNENLQGVLIEGGDIVKVQNNLFTIEDFGIASIDGRKYGLYLKGAHGYEVSYNTFRSINGVQDGAGCVAWNTSTQSHFIKNNTFNNLTAGVVSSGNNASTEPKYFISWPGNYARGLKVTCNTFNNTSTNIYVAGGYNPYIPSDPFTNLRGFSSHQGSCLNNKTTANNLLDINKNEIIFDVPNVNRYALYIEPTSNNQRYHLQDGKYTPLNYTVSVGVEPYICPTTSIGSANTPPHLASLADNPCLAKLYNDDCIQCMRKEIDKATDTYDDEIKKIELNNDDILIGTINDIEKTDVQIRNALLASSPYLSDDVLLATLNKTVPLNEVFVKQIIIPNSPVSDAVRPTLDNKIATFSNGVKNQIIAAQTGVSERTLLDSKLSQIIAYKSEIIYDMARYYLSDSLSSGIDSVISLLENNKNETFLPWLTKLYIVKRDFIKAQIIIAELATKPGYEYFIKLMTVAINLEETLRKCDELTLSEKEDIEDVAIGTCNISKYNSDAWLKYYYEFNGVKEYVELPTTQTQARAAYNSTLDNSQISQMPVYDESNTIPYELINSKYHVDNSIVKFDPKKVQNFFFDFNPNPAKTIVNFNFLAANDFKSANIEIMDVQGKSVITKTLQKDKEQHFDISIENLKSGTYICKLIVDNSIIESKQLIKE